MPWPDASARLFTGARADRRVGLRGGRPATMPAVPRSLTCGACCCGR